MKYHIQEHLYNKEDRFPRGSCYPTVIACLLDMELHEVPYFHLLYFRTEEEKQNMRKLFEGKYFKGLTLEQYQNQSDKDDNSISNYTDRIFNALHWIWDNVREYWLASKGYKETYILKESIDQWVKEHPKTPYIVSGKSPRGISHVVIYENGKMIHDPHPGGAGVFETEDEKFSYSFIEKIFS
jgi:hypothetical protein